MSTILALLCKQASYPGRGAALGTVAGGLAGYGLADEDQRIEGAAAGAALGGLGGYGLGRAYTHRPLGPAITNPKRLLGAGGEGAAELEELFAAYPTRSSLLERAHGGAAVAPPNDSTAKALTRHVHENLAGGAGIGAVSAGYASDEEDRNTSMLRGAMGGAILGGMVSMPHVVATKHLMGPETEHAARIARGNNGRKTRDLGELVEKQREVAGRFGTLGRAVGVPFTAMNGVNVAEEVRAEKRASFLPRVVLNQGLAGTALGAAGGALSGGEDHRLQGAAMGAVTGGLAGLGTGAMAHRAYNAAHAPLAKREQLSKLVQQGILDQTPSPLGRAMVTAQGDDARRTIREGVTQAAQDSSKMTRRVGGALGTLGAMGVAETLRAQPSGDQKTAAILDAIFKVH